MAVPRSASRRRGRCRSTRSTGRTRRRLRCRAGNRWRWHTRRSERETSEPTIRRSRRARRSLAQTPRWPTWRRTGLANWRGRPNPQCAVGTARRGSHSERQAAVRIGLTLRRRSRGDNTTRACSSHVCLACVRGGACRRAPRNECATPPYACPAAAAARCPAAPAAAWASAGRAAALPQGRQTAAAGPQSHARAAPPGRRRQKVARASAPRPVRRCLRCRPARARAGPGKRTRRPTSGCEPPAPAASSKHRRRRSGTAAQT